MQDTKENLNHQIYEIFPTVIYRGEVDCHDQFKEKFIDELCEYWHWSEDLPRGEINSPENSGRYFLHLEKKYEDFFNSLNKNVRNYLRILDVDEQKLNVYVTKSWINIHRQDLPEIKVHNHNCSDISFCYYLNSNETSNKLCFHQTENKNEVSEFLFETSNQKFSLVKKFNRYNCNNFTVSPLEGTVVLFPSHMLHSTIRQEFVQGTRVSICGDITLTLKEEFIKCEYSRVDPSLWKKVE